MPRLQSVRRLLVRHRWFLPALAVGSGLLVLGIWKVDPHLLLVDEYAAIGRALKMGVERDPVPETAVKGGNLHLYLLALSFAVVFAYLFVTGKLAAIDVSGVGGENAWEQVLELLNTSPAFADAFYAFVLAGRLVSALLGVATIVVVYRLAGDLYDRRTGTFAAALLAVSEGFVVTAHFATEDIVLTFLTALFFMVVAHHHRTDDDRYLLASAGVLGLAVSAKALGGLLLFPLAVTILSRGTDGARSLRRVVTTGGACGLLALGAYALTTPTVFVHPAGWWESVMGGVTGSVGGYTSFDPENGPLKAVASLLRQLGLPAFALALLGAGVTASRRSDGWVDAVEHRLLGFTAVYLVVVSLASGILFWRLVPLVPLLAVFGGRFVTFLIDHGRDRRVLRTVAAGLVVVAFVFSFANAAAATGQFFNDPREMATEWAGENVETSATVDVYSPRIHLPEFDPDVTVNRYRLPKASERERTEAIRRLYCAKPDYVVISSYQYENYLHNPGVQPAVTEMYRRLLSGETAYETTASFGRPREAESTSGDPLVSGVIPGTTIRTEHSQTILVFERTGTGQECDREDNVSRVTRGGVVNDHSNLEEGTA